jgi:hypothetical protein
MSGKRGEPFRNVEAAHSLGPVELVGAEGDIVSLYLPHVYRDLSHGLHRVQVKRNALLAADLAEVPYRIYGDLFSLLAQMMETRAVFLRIYGIFQNVQG